jgi:hypothetical protein
MASIHPIGRPRLITERSALRQGLAVAPSSGQPLRLATSRTRYCANCAGSVEFGAVLLGNLAFCSVECSLEGRPA